MTENLRRQALADLEKNDTVGKLEQAQASSTLRLSHIEQSKTEPLVYTAFGVRTVRTVNSQQESIDQLVEEYHVRLVNVDRSAQNPSGLLVGDYWSKQIEGRKERCGPDRRPVVGRRNRSGGREQSTMSTEAARVMPMPAATAAAGEKKRRRRRGDAGESPGRFARPLFPWRRWGERRPTARS